MTSLSIEFCCDTLRPTVNLYGHQQMENELANPYLPPKSAVQTEASTSSEAYFFAVSPIKLTLMSFCTFGLYELFWFYKNWVIIRERTGKNLLAFVRAFFAPIWAYSCFKHIKTSAINHNLEASISIGLLAVAYFILSVLWQLPDPYWLVSCFTFTCLLPANDLAIKLNAQLTPEFNNNKFSAWNWVALVLGGSFFILAIIGTFMPAEY